MVVRGVVFTLSPRVMIPANFVARGRAGAVVANAAPTRCLEAGKPLPKHRKPFPHANLAATVAALKDKPPSPPVMLCGICGGAATRQLPKGLHTDKLGDYCDKHDWRGNPQPAVHPSTFTFGNNAVEAPEPRTPWSDGRPMRGPQSLSGFAQ